MKIPGPGGLAIYAGIGALVVAVGYVLMRKAKGDARGFTEIIAEGVARTAVDAAEGVAVGAVKGVGAAVGIPDTDAVRCAAAKAAGDTLQASVYCDAGDFLTWSANRVLGRPTEQTVSVASDRPTLRLGSSGPDVVALQTRLGIAADGQFGPQTQAAVKAFQLSVGLIQDGIVGPHTWQALESNRAVINQNGILIRGEDRDLIR